MCRARHLASADSLSLATSVPATFTSPLSGRSMPAMRLRSVVFPDPEGPIRPRNSPSGTSSEMSCSTGIAMLSRRYDFDTPRTWTIELGMSSSLLHGDFGAGPQAGADAIDHLNAGA